MAQLINNLTNGNARIGMVNFINTAPCYEIWRDTVSQPEWHIFEGPPAQLNRMLNRDELDLGFISSHEYAVHPEKYRLLPDLSISASGPVGSVLLFSRFAPTDLTDRTILLSPQSQTSNSLVRIILEDFYGVKPCYATHRQPGAEKLADAVLAIGDEALQRVRQDTYPVILDLAEVWNRKTGLPFVFAVWAVREQYEKTHPETVQAIRRELKRCIHEGTGQLAMIAARVAPRIPMPQSACIAYLQSIEYDLDGQKEAALSRFITLLIARGEAPSCGLPLKFCREGARAAA